MAPTGTVAVSVTGAPNTDGFGDAVSVTLACALGKEARTTNAVTTERNGEDKRE